MRRRCKPKSMPASDRPGRRGEFGNAASHRGAKAPRKNKAASVAALFHG
jgi:hypothetical protein